MPNPAAEALVGALERSGRFRMIVTSRERPSWATSRRRVHLEILEIGAASSPSTTEVAELIPNGTETCRPAKQARGWPAVIALAAYSESSEVPLSVNALSASLYDYFAEELYERSEPCGATMPGDDRGPRLHLEPEELGDFLGVDGAAGYAVSTGLRTRGRSANRGASSRPGVPHHEATRPDGRPRSCWAGLDLALTKGLYDHAFGLIKEFRLSDSLERLITASYSALIETGRIATLAGYARYAAANGDVPQHLLDLIAAEVALIDGRFELAYELLGSSSAHGMVDGHSLKARGYNVAGRGGLAWLSI